jgi:acyl-CoA thioester hydrolase
MGRINYIEDMDKWAEGFQFYHPVKVRFSETDMFGHLNNTVPFTYFELARIEFFKHIGFMQDWVKPANETIPVVADLQCDFLKQVYFDETIDIYVKANKVGTSSVDIHYMGRSGKGEICFTGRGTMVQISKKTGKGVPWTDEMKNLLSNPENPAIIK